MKASRHGRAADRAQRARDGRAGAPRDEAADGNDLAQPDGPARPGFAAGYPTTEPIDRLLRRFEAGDHGGARQEAARLIRETSDEQERLAARDLVRRLGPHPLSVLLFALSVSLLVLLALHYLGAHP